MYKLSIKNLKDFTDSLAIARENVSDLTEPLTSIAKDWMRSNAAFFKQSPGVFADLKNEGPSTHIKGFGAKKTGEMGGQIGGYKREKQRKWGFIYPILRASGALERSMTVFGDPGNLFEILNKSSMQLGTRVVSSDGKPYPKFLNEGFTTRNGSRVPGRKFMQVPEISVARWKKTIRDYVLESFGPPGKPAVAMKKHEAGSQGSGPAVAPSSGQGGGRGRSSQSSKNVPNTEKPTPISRGGGGGSGLGGGSSKKKKKKA